MKTSPERFQIHSNGKLRSIVLPSGQGGLFHDWVALTRFSEASPQACGPMLYLSESEDISTSLEVGVAPSVDIEIRKIRISNHATHQRKIELTSYAEISLNHPLGDAGHPAFSKLFVQTSVTDGAPILLARRRPRGLNEHWPWLAQTLVSDGEKVSWETNRATFIGRGRTPLDPVALDSSTPLSCQTGNVLDPVMAWRCPLTLGPSETKTVWLITAAAADEATATDLARQCQSPGAAADFLAQAKAATTQRLSDLALSPAAAAHYDFLAGQMLCGKKSQPTPQSLIGSDVVHRHPLSWEELRIVATAGLLSEGCRDLLAALPYWRALGLQPRLFVMESPGSTLAPDGVSVLDPADFTAAQLSWWLASAQLVVGHEIPQPFATTTSLVSNTARKVPTDSRAEAGQPLQHFNGHGGFSADGHEYVIPMDLKNGSLHLPPMPWVNVLANPHFGCIVTERGAGYTWSRNSQANRLTPWSNDPISDPHGEALYLRDEASGEVWSPLPGPCPPQSAFVVRHGYGRSRLKSSSHDIFQSVEFLVPPEDPVKLVSIRLKNKSSQPRPLNFASYQQLLLGSSPDRHHATLAWTDADGTQYASNPRAGDFAGGRVFSMTCLHGAVGKFHPSIHSSSAFLGDGGTASPSSLSQEIASVPTGLGRDACFSSRVSFTLPAGGEVEILIVLGEAMTEAQEALLVKRYRLPNAIRDTGTDAFWQRMLGGVKITTPLPEVDLMVNGWLVYQNLACRIWGRSAFYQSGGAFGFRDQLQDSGALAAVHPEMMRSQILIHAAQQFPEGDVTHWWHPAPMDRGMRTKFADDLLWLPYLTSHYLSVTGDAALLDELRPFIEGPLLGPGEDEEYMLPTVSKKQASVFEHGCLAIDKSLATGIHHLPLMGIGDWNDGMSRIGREGKGESVWMGFFLITILETWIPLCEKRGETARVKTYTSHRANLLAAVNDAGWDGNWYRRAYYDDGTPLGTHTDDECRIDALAQAWAIISKAAPADRTNMALDSLESELVDEKHSLIRLLHPPFVNTPHDPGYIKGYVAGVRENGGQYTHAACWVIRAMAEAGRRDEAAKLLQRLSPVWHSRDAEAVATYQVEPYVVAADIYGADPHQGRGGWTWYTGSAGWMYRVATESVLGFRLENGDSLVLDPRIPDSWPGFSIDYRSPSGKTRYHIQATVTAGNASHLISLTLDSQALPLTDGIARWPLLDDGATHSVQVTLGAAK